MDTATKERLKWKFFRLVLVLDLIILLVAVGIVMFFIASPDRKVPILGILVLSVSILTVYFWGNYKKTKQWLDDQQFSIPDDTESPEDGRNPGKAGH